jgi:hypothetical protein
VNASVEELGLCHGFGAKKVERFHSAMRHNLINKKRNQSELMAGVDDDDDDGRDDGIGGGGDGSGMTTAVTSTSGSKRLRATSAISANAEVVVLDDD